MPRFIPPPFAHGVFRQGLQIVKTSFKALERISFNQLLCFALVEGFGVGFVVDFGFERGIPSILRLNVRQTHRLVTAFMRHVEIKL
jgi:hypothetical protein